HLGGDLLPHVRPQAAGLGRGEGLQLQAAVTAHHGDPGGLVIGHADLHLAAVSEGHLHAPEVDPLGGRHVVIHVPPAAHRGLARRPPPSSAPPASPAPPPPAPPASSGRASSASSPRRRRNPLSSLSPLGFVPGCRAPCPRAAVRGALRRWPLPRRMPPGRAEP